MSLIDLEKKTFSYSNCGHTPGLLLTELGGAGGSLLFCGDLIPGRPWLHLPITMGYDRYPELLIDEKREMLERVRAEYGWLFFTHDEHVAAAKVALDAKGRYSATELQQLLHWR